MQVFFVSYFPPIGYFVCLVTEFCSCDELPFF